MSGSASDTLETEALTAGMLGSGNRKKPPCSRFTALERGLLASLALAVIFILLLTSVIVLLSCSTTSVREERKTSERLREDMRLHVSSSDSGRVDEQEDTFEDEDVFESDMSERDRRVLKELLNREMARKTLEQERAFAKRYPRDQYRSSAAANTRRLIHNLPRPLRQVSRSEEDALTASEKVAGIMYSLDDDNDMASDPWELHN